MPGAVDYALANGYGDLFLRLRRGVGFQPAMPASVPAFLLCGADPPVCAGPPGPALG